MKSTSQFALAGLLLANCSAFAATPAEGWYAGLMGGLSYAPNVQFLAPDPNPLITLNAFYNPVIQNRPALPTQVILRDSFFPGWFSVPFLNANLQHGIGGDFGAQVGYRICNFRLEGELLLNYDPLASVRVGGAKIAKHVTLVNPIRATGQTGFGAGLFNVYYDFYDEENDPTWIPYAGLGIGYAYTRNTVTFTVPYLFDSTFSYHIKNSKSAPIGQAILGISYYYSDTTAFGLDYRYLTTQSISDLGGRVQASTINFNFNHWFED